MRVVRYGDPAVDVWSAVVLYQSLVASSRLTLELWHGLAGTWLALALTQHQSAQTSPPACRACTCLKAATETVASRHELQAITLNSHIICPRRHDSGRDCSFYSALRY